MKKQMNEMQIRRSVSCFLLTLLSVSAIACADNADVPPIETEDTAVTTEAITEAVTEDPALRDSLPEADLGGMEFRMTIFGNDNQRIMTYVEESDGNPVNDAVYNKIRTVEERFNTDIVLTDLSMQEVQESTLKNVILAGDDFCELAQGHDVVLANNSLEGLFVNIYDIPHLDFSKPWWSKATLESMTVSDQMYLMFNNISYNNLTQMHVMYFNKDLMQALDMEYPYQMVYDGTWTMDAMKEMSAQAYSDLNGNGEVDIGDQFGYISQPYYYGIFEPFRVEPYRKDSNGELYYEVDLARTQEIVDNLYDLIFGAGGYWMSNKVDNYMATALSMVSAGRSLFYYGPMDKAVYNFAYSDLSYGLLPMPKLDASEEGYYGAGYDRPLVVPITAEERLDTIGLVVEALNAEGYKQVFPAYYELAMKSRYADQTDDAKMIDIMHDNIIISFTFIHDNYGSVYGKMLWDLFNKSNPSKDVASWCAKNEKSQSNRVEFLKEFFAERNS